MCRGRAVVDPLRAQRLLALVEGGHIGYAVRPNHRRRGHATEILRQSLVVARAGGVLENIAEVDGVPLRRYWID